MLSKATKHVPAKTLPILTVRFDNELVSTQPPPSQKPKLTIKLPPLQKILHSVEQQPESSSVDTHLQVDNDLPDEDTEIWDQVE